MLARPNPGPPQPRVIPDSVPARTWNLDWQLTAFCFLLALTPCRSSGQPSTGESYVTRSTSGQFIVHASQSSSALALAFSTAPKAGAIHLDAARLTVAAERIKQVLWRNLAATAAWKSKIHLYLHPVNPNDETITIASDQFKDGWQYGVNLPEDVDRVRFARAMVQVLLLEMANRTAADHGAEIPTWLGEGLTEQVLNDRDAGLIPPAARRGGKGLDSLDITRSVWDIRSNQPLARAHQDLRKDQNLSFDELSWPNEDRLAGQSGEVYRSSAQLFVSELARLKDGRTCLRSMVETLPAYLNWQLAFLQAFQPYFKTAMEVEKWWALRSSKFTEQDLAQNWSVEESWHRLDRVLHSSLQVRTRPNDLPLHAEASLQTIIKHWDAARQMQTLQNKVLELELLRMRIAPELAALVEDYRQSLTAYLQNGFRAIPISERPGKASGNRAPRDTLVRLDALDARRESLRPLQNAVPPRVQAQPDPSEP